MQKGSFLKLSVDQSTPNPLQWQCLFNVMCRGGGRRFLQQTMHWFYWCTPPFKGGPLRFQETANNGRQMACAKKQKKKKEEKKSTAKKIINKEPTLKEGKRRRKNLQQSKWGFHKKGEGGQHRFLLHAAVARLPRGSPGGFSSLAPHLSIAPHTHTWTSRRIWRVIAFFGNERGKRMEVVGLKVFAVSFFRKCQQMGIFPIAAVVREM